EGGTDDEEFRNAAVVDRVNTTMAVWMAASMACAQCHNHKYDPITQQDYFRMFAFFNNSQDADLKDETPLLEVFSATDKEQRVRWQKEIAEIENKFKSNSPASEAAQANWEKSFSGDHRWLAAKPLSLAPTEGAIIEE